jgi:hypothetical protein
MKGILHKALTIVICMSFVSVAFAQRGMSDYQIKGDKVFYNGRAIAADVRTFRILGHGYAKDRMNVYLDGMVLRYVDPSTFRLHVSTPEPRGLGSVSRGRGVPEPNHYFAPKYVVSRYDVMFDGRKVQGASANTFKDLHDGYAMDAFTVYYFGEKLNGAVSSSFRNLGAGYALDAFGVYYRGEKMRETVGSSSFRVLDDGYARDAFNVYFCGKKIKVTSVDSFVCDGDGYAHDTFRKYYMGEIVR